MEKRMSFSVDELITSGEVIKILGISRSRLSQLIKSKKITRLKKNMFFIQDVLDRKEKQDGLREKYYRPPSK